MTGKIKGRGMVFRRCLGTLGLALALLFALSATASAHLSFCSTGSGAGQCKDPAGVSVDSSSGNVYVADSGNNRIDVFTSTGGFLFAFGWGVADGVSAEPQTCTTTCFAGIPGGGAGQFSQPRSIAVDPSSPHDLYVFEQLRVQRFDSDGNFSRTWGGGAVTGGALGRGSLSAGSRTISNVVTDKKSFAAGQLISGLGIPAGTRIASIGAGTMSLSKAATATGANVILTVAEGAANVPVNEVQVLSSVSAINRGLSFSTRDPSPSSASIEKPLPIAVNAPASGPGSVQQLLEGFSNINPGDIAVTGPSGGPYAIEFTGRYADTNVEALRDLSSSGEPISPPPSPLPRTEAAARRSAMSPMNAPPV